jgi:uncharacterized protein (TIGR03435 family)
MNLRTPWAAAIALSFHLANAQSAFDAASIKPAAPGTRGYSIRPLGNRLSAQNVTLKMLIGEAYHVYNFQISGGPKWIDSDRYDIEAKAVGDAPPTAGQIRAMLQKLLADRFALVIRRESKDTAVLSLEAAKSGPKIEKARRPAAPVTFRVFQRRQITAENASLDRLVEALNVLLGKPVIDRTGLTGTFDYKLEWSPDERQAPSSEAPPEVDGSSPPISSALQEQLGLRLVSTRAPLDLIVVEKAEKPSAN